MPLGVLVIGAAGEAQKGRFSPKAALCRQRLSDWVTSKGSAAAAPDIPYHRVMPIANGASFQAGDIAIENAPMARLTDTVAILEALTHILRIAIEHAVFTNRFEIDEQEPPSRLEALTEQLLCAGSNLARNGASEAVEVATRAVVIQIIREASTSVGAAMHN